MAKRKVSARRMVVGSGPYDLPGNMLSGQVAQRVIMDAIAAVVPTVLHDLARLSYPAYVRREQYRHEQNPTIETLPAANEAEEALQRALASWEDEHPLSAPWYRGWALATMRTWYALHQHLGHDPRTAEHLLWSPPFNVHILPLPASARTPAPFDSPTWNPWGEDDEYAYIAAAVQQYETHLRTFIATAKAALRQAGCEETPKKREATLRLHARWLVRYQLLNDSYEAIADNHAEDKDKYPASYAAMQQLYPKGLTSQAVGKDVRGLATMAGLTLRDGKKGKRRPRIDHG